MSKSNEVPTLGQPVFVISENSLDERLGIADGRGYFQGLMYFAHNAIIVKKLGYIGDSLTKIVINEDMVASDDTKKSLEVRVDLEKNFSKQSDATTVFFNEADAAACAEQMNINQRKNCKKISDLIVKGLSTYDDIIAACKLPSSTR